MKANRVIVHVGQIKTGSTALQACFCENLDTLKISGILYPVERATNTPRLGESPLYDHNLLAGFSGDFDTLYPPLRQRYKNATTLSQNISAFTAATEQSMRRYGYETLLLSAEFLSEASQSTLEALRDWLLGMLGSVEIHIALYVRSPQSAYLSQAVQRVKSGFNFITPDRFLLDYRTTIERLWSVFGADHVDVLNYDTCVLDHGDVVAAFADRYLGLPLRGRRLNESLSLEAVLFLDEYWYTTGSVGIHGRARFELLVQWLEVNPYRHERTFRAQLLPSVESLVAANHRCQLAFLAEIGIVFPPPRGLDAYETRLDILRIRDILSTIPDESAMSAFKSFAVDGLLNACVVMNELIAGKS